MSDNTDFSEFELDKKWENITKGHHGGWTAIPNLLLKQQGTRGLKALEINVLMNLIRFWWIAENSPFPSPEKMSQEMGVSARTVYRTLASLDENGFINRLQEDGQATKYELNGLVEKLKAIKNTM